MGAVSFSIDVTMVALFRQALPLRVFVETGTFEGDAVALVLPEFREIHTVELSEGYYAKAVERFRSSDTVTVHHDDSARVLAALRSRLERESVLYWLDAHWCVADDIAGKHSECPLLAELEAIGTLNSQSVVMIDDARLFLCTPPKPHDTGHWPRFQEVIQRLSSLSSDHEIMVINDVIVFFPTTLVSNVSEYAHANSIDWLVALRRLEELEKNYDMLTSSLAERLTLIEEMHAEQELLHRALAERSATIEELNRLLRS
jgi:hypothetical protein